ncbi:MAG: T9SS type A sorting domain-containing protein, partial [Anaerolineae bacterium]
RQKTDAAEPNNSIAEATPIAYNAQRSGYLDPPGDKDFYMFTGTFKDFIQVDVEALTLGSNLDAVVRLLNSSGVEIAKNDDEVSEINLDPLLEFELPASGTYYIVVESFVPTGGGSGPGGPSYFYEFTLKKVLALPRLTHTTGNVDFTVWSNGIYGDDGNGTGNGFSFLGSPGGTLFSGGFVAMTPTLIAANIPSLALTQTQSLIDFEQVKPFTPFTSDNNFDRIADCEYDEGSSNNLNSPIGIQVKQTSYSNANNDFVLVECEVVNTSGGTISNLYLGQFGDWDVGLANFESNRGGYDASRNLTYQFETGSNPNDPNYYGIKALQAASGARVTTELDPNTLNGFISNFNGPGPQPITTDGDYRSFIGSGPFTLSSNESVTVGFAWIGGSNLADLQANADAAQAAWDNLVVSVEDQAASNVPREFSLAQNYPNPFNPSTKIKYALVENSEVSLVIYNMLGQQVRTLVDARQDANFYEVEWDGRDDVGNPLSSGVYFYWLKAGQNVKVHKMLLLK